MGLDMYLTARRFIWYNEEPIKNSIRSIFPDIPGDPKAIEYEAAYWRKANQIHKWFVDHVQGGTDDCGTYDVSLAQLATLVELCKNVLDNRQLAPDELPTTEGFFFGAIEYDEDYFNDLKYTIKTLTPIIDKIVYKGWDFQYHSSW